MRDTMNRPRLPWCRKELGHHATRATRFALVTVWLAAPWRMAVRLVLGLCLALVGGLRAPLTTAVVAIVTVAMAVAQSVQAGDLLSAGLLAGVAVAAVAAPLVDAAVSRRSELAADRYAAAVGLGRELAGALAAIDTSRAPRGWMRRLLDRHPPTSRRLDVLSGWSAGGA